MKNATQHQMFKEIEEKKIFEQSQAYAFEYLDNIFDRNVYPTEAALANLPKFEEDFPEHSTAPYKILEQLHRYGSPATNATMGGRYFGFVNGSALPIGLAAKTLASFWDQCPAMHVLSPIGSQLESVVEKWLIHLFNLPKESCAGFVSGTSMANLSSLAAARCRILKNNNWDISKKGLYNAPKIRIVTGQHAHSTILKSIGMLGLGQDNIEWVEVDEQGRMIPELMPELDKNTLLILQAGNVNSGSFDDFKTICKKANMANAWVHIDGAFGLWAAAAGPLKYLTEGIELADSWAVDGHKTLNTPYDCGIVLCKDKEAMVEALHMTGSYIIRSEQRDGMLYTPEMSRRARIIELWAIIKYLGKTGIDNLILTMHQRAKQFGEEISQLKGFQVENDIVFNQVLVRCENDRITETVLANIQKDRVCWLGGAVWHHKKVIRVSVCSWATTEKDISLSVDSFKRALDKSISES